jgi:hypothetical protein
MMLPCVGWCNLVLVVIARYGNELRYYTKVALWYNSDSHVRLSTNNLRSSSHPITPSPYDPITQLSLQHPVRRLRGGGGVERIGAAVENAVRGVPDRRR